MNKKLFDYIRSAPTPFHAVAETKARLRAAGYAELFENSPWEIEAGKGYFVTRNGSSLIAFRTPSKDFCGYMMTAAHCDSPAFKIKENAELRDKYYVRLSTERYGGMLCATWMDRPLSVAGRIAVKTENGMAVRLVDLKEPCAVIPSVAIHMNRNANDGASYNAAVDMLPLYGEGEKELSLKAKLAEAAGVAAEDILTTDLILYNPQEGFRFGTASSPPRALTTFSAPSAPLRHSLPPPRAKAPLSIAFLITKRWAARPSRAQLPPSLRIPLSASAKALAFLPPSRR